MATILVVDDRPTNREVLATLLGYKGHLILEASDGAEGLEIASSSRPDLIISDIVMPTMDGYEFVRRLRLDSAIAKTPVVFYSATYLEKEARALAEACGVRYILTKPVEPAALLSTVDAALGLSLPPPTPPPAPPADEFDREHLQLVTDKLSQKVDELETVNGRLSALIDLGQRLSLEHDPLKLLDLFCHESRRVIGSKYSGIGIMDERGEGLSCFITSGIDAQIASRLGVPSPEGSLLGTLPTERNPRRLHGLKENSVNPGLPPNHPPIASFLCVPLASPTKAYGWMYLADKLGADRFGEEDERLAVMLASQLAMAYENAMRYDQLQQRAVELENVIKELESFSYSVSHDLRAPLRAVIGFSTATMEDYGEKLDAEGKRYLDTIHNSAVRMGQLIDDLLTFSRLGRKEMTTSNINMTSLVKGVFEELSAASPGRKFQLNVGELPAAQGDRAMVRQVFVNLLSNAVKFTRGREVAMIEVGSRKGDYENVYYVKDNGAGFDMRYADKLFGVFQRLHSAEEFEGTGVGLSIVRRVVHRHGGRVWAEGEVDKGAAFYFTLPPGGKED